MGFGYTDARRLTSGGWVTAGGDVGAGADGGLPLRRGRIRVGCAGAVRRPGIWAPMQIVFHIGLHGTDADRVLRCLLRNADRLATAGVAVPLPGTFRPVLKDALIARRGVPSTVDEQETMRHAMFGEDVPSRVVFSNDNFLCPPHRAVDGGTLYPLAGERMPWVTNLFPDHERIVALAMRNPATLLPALHARIGSGEDLASYVGAIAPEELSWADAIARLTEAIPGIPLLVWCGEDAPLIWPEILGALTGMEDPAGFEGTDELLETIMTEAGLERMRGYLQSHPPRNAEHRRRITAAFLDKFVRPEAVEMELDLPGWSEDRVARITARYEADIDAIGAMPGVSLIRP